MPSYSIQDVMAKLPHRYPMLLVDKVISSSSTEVVAIKNVTINEPYFTGHFSNNPVMPGVLILDALTQASAFIESVSITNADVVYLVSVDKVRFRKPVVPGDQLVLKVSVLLQRDRLLKFIGKAYVNDDLVADAEITTVLET